MHATHGPGIDEPLIMERAGKSYFYHLDGLGSVTEITDKDGNIINNYIYDSFGNIMRKTEGIKNFYTYTSREYDEETELYYYRNRYYNSNIGRFLTPDPSNNTFEYHYVENNPINFSDSLGLGKDKVIELEEKPWWMPQKHWEEVKWAWEESRKSGYGGFEDGPADAYRHCIWQCSMTAQYEEQIASLYGTGKAIRDYLDEPKVREMDLANNEVGRKIGKDRCITKERKGPQYKKGCGISVRRNVKKH